MGVRESWSVLENSPCLGHLSLCQCSLSCQASNILGCHPAPCGNSGLPAGLFSASPQLSLIFVSLTFMLCCFILSQMPTLSLGSNSSSCVRWGLSRAHCCTLGTVFSCSEAWSSVSPHLRATQTSMALAHNQAWCPVFLVKSISLHSNQISVTTNP